MNNLKPKGSQFVTLYRGVKDVNDDATIFTKRTGNMGQSWSTDRSVAERFAGYDDEGYATPGQVVTAKVHNRHIMTGAARRTIPGIHSTRSLERELPVRKGGIIHIQSVDTINENGDVTRWPSSDVTAVFGNRRTGRA